MAESKDDKDLKTRLNDLLKEKETFKELLAMSKLYGSSLGLTEEHTAEAAENLEKQLSISERLNYQSKYINVSEEKRLQLRKLSANLADGASDIAREEAQAKADLLLKQLMLNTGLTGAYAEQAKQLSLAKQLGYISNEEYQKQLQALKTQQAHNRHIEEQTELTEALAAYTVEVREEAEKLKKEYTLLGAKIKAIVTDPEVRKAFIKGALLEKSVEMGKELVETFGEFRKEGLSVTTAFKETGLAAGAMFSLSGASMKENAEIMAGLAESTGNLDSTTREAVVEVGKLSQTFGIAAGEAGKLYGQIKNLPGATEESALNTMEFAGNLAKAAHVAPGAVMKDMATNSEAIAANTKNGGKDMVAVSVAAHKLGIEMSSITKMSENLLNFEDSINKQMEASVLLGREINLDKAREAALNGDLLGATQEMLKNVGGEAEFNKMNVMQRKALAESMGVSVSELSKMVKNQDKLANLTQEQQEALATGEVTMDELLANSGGVAKNMWNTTTALAGNVVATTEMVKGLRDGLGITKDLFRGLKEGAGFLGKLKGGVGGLFGAKKPEVPTPPVTPPSTPGDNKAGMLDKISKLKPGQMFSIALAIVAVGAALMMIGKGIQYASEGLATLVQSFKGLSSEEMNSALIAITVVMLGFAGMMAIMIPLISTLGAASTAVAGPLLALGLAFLMIGVGIAAAALGIGYMVKQFGEIPYANLMALPAAMIGIGAGLYMMGAAGLMAIPVLGMLIALGKVAPMLSGIKLGGMGQEGGKSSSLSDNSAVLDSLGQLIEAVGVLTNTIANKKGDVIIDKERIGTVLMPIIERKIVEKSKSY